MSHSTAVSVKEGDVVHDRYFVERLLGVGSFGSVFMAKDQLLDNKKVAIKVERRKSIILQEYYQLHVENMVLKELDGGQLDPYTKTVGGFPAAYHFGALNKLEQFLVMDLLGPSLQSMFTICKNNFTLKTILIIVDQLLYRLQYLHSKGYIHRDLKPDNILLGTIGKSVDILHLIDFGLSTVYWSNTKTKEHIKECVTKSDGSVHRGNLKYMSCRGHFSHQASRRDDLESLAYILAYLLRGDLPWQKVPFTAKKQKNKAIAELKMSTTPEKLFEGFPEQFAEFLTSVRQLKFDEKPNYRMYQRKFRELGKIEGIVYGKGGQFDWELVDSGEEGTEEKCDT